MIERIRALGRRLDGRLDAALLRDALDYLEFNEWGLALETLASQSHEELVVLSRDEVSAFLSLGEEMNLPASRFAFLGGLVAVAKGSCM